MFVLTYSLMNTCESDRSVALIAPTAIYSEAVNSALLLLYDLSFSIGETERTLTTKCLSFWLLGSGFVVLSSIEAESEKEIVVSPGFSESIIYFYLRHLNRR